MNKKPEWLKEGAIVSKAFHAAHPEWGGTPGIVMLAAGQSNMEWPVKDTINKEELKQKIAGTNIHWLMVPCKEFPDMPETTEFAWRKLDETNLEDVSGVALFAALEMAKYTDEPIGLVGCYRGGSSAASWVPRHVLEQHAAIRQFYITDYEVDIKDQTNEQEDALRAAFDKEVTDYNERFAAYEKAHPEMGRSELKAVMGHTPFPGPKGKKDFLRPSGLYENMAVRLEGLMPDVLLWYQGEEDSKAAHLYHDLLEMTISTWKKLTGKDMPVVVAQLPGYRESKEGRYWGPVRKAQQDYGKEHDNVSVVCLLDAGDHENIHPTDKRIPGTRMGKAAAAALRLTDADVYPQAVAADACRVQLSDGLVLDWDRPAYGYDNDPDPVLFGDNGLPVLPFDKADLKEI